MQIPVTVVLAPSDDLPGQWSERKKTRLRDQESSLGMQSNIHAETCGMLLNCYLKSLASPNPLSRR
jgi:hypothetical protein